jgi:hypothetical protein
MLGSTPLFARGTVGAECASDYGRASRETGHFIEQQTDPESPQKVMEGKENDVLQCGARNGCKGILTKDKQAFVIRLSVD